MSTESAVTAWTARADRAEELRERYPFASQVLTLYLALLPVQEEAYRTTPSPEELVPWAGATVLPAVVDATVAAGPPALREAVRTRDERAEALTAWLADAELDAVDGYLARATLGPALEALGERAAEVCAPSEGAVATCPHCGGLPQLSVLVDSGETLVTGRRELLCSRCAWRWDFTRNACPSCGEEDDDKLLVYTERWGGPVSSQKSGNGGSPAVFPSLRIAGCATCRRYLIDVDLAREGRAVPEVDELAAVPLDLYAADRELTKVTPNLMGF